MPDSAATLDANPSIELTVNKLGQVLSVRACNAARRSSSMSWSYQPAAADGGDAIVAELQADGYVSADANSILVTVEVSESDASVQRRLLSLWRMHRATAGLLPAVLAQVLEHDPALEADAAAVGVSAGKAMLIRQISAQVRDLTGSELVGLPINDLNILAASNQVELSDMISIGAASTGAYIPYDQAMDAALACMLRPGCGQRHQASMRFTLIDGQMVMEFVLTDGEHHYVCSVDARTAEICCLAGDEPLGPQEAEIKPQPAR